MSIKRNFFYNFILTVSNYIFPLLTYPYVSRILGVNNIGICNFVDSIINYFILFSMMGLMTIGIREVAKYKNDREKLNQTFSSIILLNIIFTIIAMITLVILTFSLKVLIPYKELLFYGCIKLLFNVFLIEWFFQGIENFKYITIRSVIIKTLYVISIFVFVKQKGDYNLFYLLSVLMIVINSIINWQYRKKYVTLRFKNLSILPLIRSTLTLGLYHFLTSMYTTFNVAYLGFVSTTTQVGYYTTAVKFHSILIAVFSAFTSVMLPRMSDLIANNNINEFKIYTQKSFDILYTFSFPIIFGIIILSPEIIYLFSGTGFEGAILPLRIIIPLILIIGLEQILIVQMLIPMKKDNVILINSIIGAFLGLSLNLLLVNKYLSVGTSIVWLISEFFVFLSAYYIVNKYIKLTLNYKLIIKNILLSIPIMIICYTVKMFFDNFLITLFASFVISFIYYLLIQIYVQKNHFILNSIVSIKRIFYEK